MRLYANAKINLTLDVCGRRSDGYHEVSMIMQSVDVHDVLDIEKNQGDSIILTCDNNTLPCDDSNLIIRAAKALMSHVGRNDGLKMHLSKNIPMAAGLAGGSADAAAALIGINELMGYGLSIDELKSIGAKLGADIPFCIQGGTCLAEGIGEILTPVDPMPDCYIVLVKPPFDVSTKYVYEHLDAIPYDKLTHPDTHKMAMLIKQGSIKGIAAGIGNILEEVTATGYPEILDIKSSLMSYGALGVLMSGSGPTVYALFDDKSKAEDAANGMSSKHNPEDCARNTVYKQVHLCRPTAQGVVIA